MEKSSNLINKTNEEIIEMAQHIASESFIKHGNNAVSFTDNNELRNLVGGRYKSYPELSMLVIKAYNEIQAILIITNL